MRIFMLTTLITFFFTVSCVGPQLSEEDLLEPYLFADTVFSGQSRAFGKKIIADKFGQSHSKNAIACNSINGWDRSYLLRHVQNTDAYANILKDLGRNKFTEFNRRGTKAYKALTTILLGTLLVERGEKYIQAYGFLVAYLLQRLSIGDACIVYLNIVTSNLFYRQVTEANEIMDLSNNFFSYLSHFEPQLSEILNNRFTFKEAVWFGWIQTLMLKSIDTNKLGMMDGIFITFFEHGINKESLFAMMLAAVIVNKREITKIARENMGDINQDLFLLLDKNWISGFSQKRLTFQQTVSKYYEKLIESQTLVDQRASAFSRSFAGRSPEQFHRILERFSELDAAESLIFPNSVSSLAPPNGEKTDDPLDLEDKKCLKNEPSCILKILSRFNFLRSKIMDVQWSKTVANLKEDDEGWIDVPHVPPELSEKYNI